MLSLVFVCLFQSSQPYYFMCLCVKVVTVDLVFIAFAFLLLHTLHPLWQKTSGNKPPPNKNSNKKEKKMNTTPLLISLVLISACSTVSDMQSVLHMDLMKMVILLRVYVCIIQAGSEYAQLIVLKLSVPSG